MKRRARIAKNNQHKLDPALERYYSLGREKDRLDTAPLEKARTLRILQKRLPLPPATILDVGGAYGVYAFPLAEQGYEVHLIDPIPVHIEQAQEYAKNFPSAKLASCSVSDARLIARADSSADAILFLGPLYHLVLPNDRLKALNEAYRILKKGGLLFVAAISRFQSLIDNMYKGKIHSKIELVKQDILTGLHQSENSNMCLYFHHPQELVEELKKSKFRDVSLIGIEGPVWHQGLVQDLQNDKKGWKQLLDILELIEGEETIIGASAHMMAIAKK